MEEIGMKKSWKIVLCLCLILALIIGLCACGDDAPAPAGPKSNSIADRYAYAQELLGAGRYSEAAAAFDEVGDYEDAAKLAKYAKAAALGESGQYDAAIDAFNSFGDYKSSSDMAVYYRARKEQAKGDYGDAIKRYNKIILFKDSAQRVEECKQAMYEIAASYAEQGDLYMAWYAFDFIASKYQYSDSRARADEYLGQLKQGYAAAQSLEQAGNYEEAIAAYEKLGDYSDCQSRIAACREQIQLKADYDAAVVLQGEGRYEEAIAAFEMLGDYNDSKAQITACKDSITEREYQAALALQQAGKYEEAIAAFEALGDYNDSKAQVTACQNAINEPNYQAAIALQQAGNYEEAIVAFEALGDYSDSKAQVTACKNAIKEQDYQAAVALLQAGKYEEAIAAFEALGDYKDCDEQITETKYLKAKSLLVKKDYAGAYALFITLKGYKDVDSLIAKDENLKAAAAREAKLKPYKTVGSYVTYGTYPQTEAGNDSTPIEWLVLEYDAKNNKALLISRYGLDCQPYNSSRTDVTWETCSLRTWLNGTFLNKAFSKAEQGAILTTEVDNSKSQCYSGYSTNGGNNTKDKVFLLSYAEALKYFKNDEARKCAPTDYAIKQGTWTSSSYKVDGRATCFWWLRSPGSSSSSAAFVGCNGARSYFDVDYSDGAVRPAFWLDLSGI